MDGGRKELLHAQGGPHLDAQMRDGPAIVSKPVRRAGRNNERVALACQDVPPAHAETNLPFDHTEALLLARVHVPSGHMAALLEEHVEDQKLAVGFGSALANDDSLAGLGVLDHA